MANQPQLLNVKEVSELVGLGVSTVWKQVRKGNFPAPIKIGGATRWRRIDLETLFSRVTAQTKTQP
jgi:predicted DNA-binding transcriptional regulator AlpA